jgi:hypothetical protein
MHASWTQAASQSCSPAKRPTSGSKTLSTGRMKRKQITKCRLNIKIDKGSLLLTTLRVIFYTGSAAVEVPLCFVSSVSKSGGMFQKDGVVLGVTQHGQMPSYMADNFTNNPKPAAPTLPKEVKISFSDKNRDNFLNLLN